MRGRRGFTLIEVMIALVILMMVIVGFVSTTSRLLHTVTTSDRQEAAVNLALDRVDQVRLQPIYPALESLYVATETSFPALPGFTRRTDIIHVGGQNQPQDHKVITVTVNGPGLLEPVVRTVTVAAP